MGRYYIGLLSGTSMDAIDAGIVDFQNAYPKLIASHAENIPDDLKLRTRQLCHPGYNEINRLGELEIEWGQLFAKAVIHLLKASNVATKDIIAIGSHGQTVRHSPKTRHPFTLQMGDPNTIAALTGITTVADFRRMDIAHGGQGAPLAPAFHHYLFQNPDHDTLVVNIGGIANITYLPADTSKKMLGYDTGPGNTLLDAWCRQHMNKPFDAHGTWAMQGEVHPGLLTRLLSDPYFSQPAPKSTGPEYFNLNWLNSSISSVDTQRTLLELTAQTIVNDSLKLAATRFCEVLICGGGARNTALMHRIQALLGNQFSVLTTESKSIPSDWLEAMLFAWLAKMRIEKIPLDLTSITGSSNPVILGGIYSSSS